MPKSKYTSTLLTALLAMALMANAHSAPLLDFETSYDDSSVEITDSWGLGEPSVNLNEGLYNTSFSLGEGESSTFDFFDITLPKLGGGEAELEATLAFLEPAGTSGTGQGNGIWFSLGFFSGGNLYWDSQPAPVELADGSIFSIAFSELKGVDLGKRHTVQATVTADTVAVPAPGTMALLGLGLLGLGAVRRSRA